MKDSIHIGERVRALRLQKGLTQQELAGDQITRNMLSLIEHGTTSPSLTTLQYLAKRLEVPIGYFFTETPEEEKHYHKSAIMDQLKRSYAAGDFGTCTELCESLPAVYADDEISMIGAYSCVKTAIRLAEQYSLNRAEFYLSAATNYSKKSVYLDDSFHRAIAYYTTLFRHLHAEEIPELLTDLSYASPLVPYDMILYFRILAMAQNPGTASLPFIGGTVYEMHLQAVLLMQDGKFNQALLPLKKLAQSTTLPYFMCYRVFSDLEVASEKVGDLRGAYVAAKKKVALLQGTQA